MNIRAALRPDRQLRDAMLAAGLVLFAAGTALAARQLQEEPEDFWPREITTDRATVVLYQPQPDTLAGNQLAARAALSITPDGEDEPEFGVVWMNARLVTDRDNRTAIIDNIAVERIAFPGSTEAQQDSLARLLENEIPRWDLDISMDRLLATLELAETRRRSAEGLSMEPPVILFRQEPAILVTIDGEPRLQKIEGSDFMRILNTAFTIIFDQGARTYYLAAGEDQWYSAPEYDGPWTLADRVPSDVAALAPEPLPEEEQPVEDEEADDQEPGPPPAIIVATEPTELIVIEGEPEYTPISGTDLMYVTNSESDVLLDLESARYFVILSGRWFTSASYEGSWVNVPADQLPDRFSQIPLESEMGHVRVSVPGTVESKEAVMENQIPQTSAIKRDTKITIEYDGDPEFEPIEGTSMTYAVNTADQVIKVGNEYYACHEGVWYEASSATGPWTVADKIPVEIYDIPADSPMYNTTYVHIYDSTPEVVYVGYYPGYTGSYVYNSTIVYGTGWYYPGWYQTYYYPRPATWGFHVRWNPWYGWSFGLSYSTGPFTFYMGRGSWYRGGWWGPGRYRGYRRGYHRGWHQGARAGYRAGYRAGSNSAKRNNIYNRQENVARNAPNDRARGQARAGPAEGRANNVYSDRDGNVLRENSNGNWDQKTRDGWQGNDAVTRDAARDRAGQGGADVQRPQTGQQPAQRPAQQPAQQPQARPQQQPQTGNVSRQSTGSNMQQNSNARSRGTTRTQNYNSQRSRSSGGRSGGRRR
jgi:hypothetical protein